jgi:tRNA-binding EMAP/Myf-like protein
MGFNLMNGAQDEDNFYSKFLVSIAQIVFCDQIFEKDKADEIKNNFEKILFSNRLYENEKNNGQDYFEISFMENLFFSPYKKLLKLKKIFDSENSSKEKNNSVIVSSILLASQFGIYHTKYSIKLILKLIANYLDLDKLKKLILQKDEHKTLHNWKKILSSYLKALSLGKWSHGLIYVLEKIGVETEDHKDETEKLYQILNLELVKILDIKKHPAADSLNLCMISNGKEVVCGAKNVHFIKDNGFYTVYAPLGSHLPNDMIISPRDIRGVISKGMLCSPDELLANGYSFLKAPLRDLEKDSEICLNRDEKTSGIFVLKESKNKKE